MLKIWERYFLREVSKIFILFLLAFYLLYVLIDYSTHSRSFHHYHFSLAHILKYYAWEFVMRMDILVPFAALVASIKTLCTLNMRNELIALRMSGVTLKRLLFPFICFGLLLTTTLYLNAELLHVGAMKYHKKLDHRRAKEKHKKQRHPYIQQVILEDASSLIFQDFDSKKNQIFDAIWLRTIDDIYRIKYLFPFASVPFGKSVEHLQRDAQGFLIITEILETKEFPEMRVSMEALFETIVSPNTQSISELSRKIASRKHSTSEKEARLLTTYYYKIAMPWLSLLVIIGLAPFCTKFSRTLPIFFIFALGIFGLMAFYLFMDAAVMLAERQVIRPSFAIGVPFGTVFAFFLWRFFRL